GCSSERLEVLGQIRLFIDREAQSEVRVVVLDDIGQCRCAAVVEVGRVLPRASKRRRAVLAGGTAKSVGRGHAGLLRAVESRRSVSEALAAVARDARGLT